MTDKISFRVEKNFCDECSLALRRFIGNMDGVESIDLEDGMVAVYFDKVKMSEEDLFRITRNSIEKLGYRLDQK